MTTKTLFNKKAKPVGEPFVWFTGVGLTLGIVMIAFLLGLILVKGLDVFWPKEAVLLELDELSSARVKQSGFLAGVVTKKQDKIVRTLENGQDISGSNQEWQIFLGNKDIYGLSFKFLDVDHIREISYPRELMRIERIEYGDAFGYPVLLNLTSGEKISFDSPQAYARLEKLVNEANARWREIKKIEKNQIGKINLEMEEIRLKERAIREGKKSASPLGIERLTERKAFLQQKYDVLAGKAKLLREAQRSDTLQYRLATGETKTLPIGQIVSFYYPNQLGFFERVSLFFHRMWMFVSVDPREANTEGGVFPAIFGTFVMTVMMSVAVMPFGVLAAIYLREYAKQGFFVRCVRIAVNNLAGVPSIVFGVFGVGFFVYFVGGSIDKLFFSNALPTPTFGTGGILWASLTLALLTVPVVIVASEEALAAVPRGMREGSLACGASKWQTIQRIVLPAAAPGILTGLILAMARGASEVAPLMLVGVVKLAPNLPLDGTFPFFHLERKFMHLGFHIYDLGFQSPDSDAAKPMVFATTLLLIGLVVILNIGAIVIRQRLRKKYATGTF